MSKVSFYRVEMDRAGQRIDNFLIGYWKKVPKSRVYRVLRKGEVRVNGKRVKPEYRLVADDEIRIPPVTLPETNTETVVPGQSLQRHLDNAILYEDDWVVAINKPSGLAVHGGSGIRLGLIESYRAMRPELRFVELVHRLDRDTSGVVLIAKKRSALTTLQAAFRAKTDVKKTYWCLVHGRWSDDVTEVDAPLRKQQAVGGERFVRVAPDGKASLTRFRVLKAYAQATWVEAQPVTGRTHQIRVHCQHAGHPILGDTKYQSGRAEQLCREMGLERLFLHAAQLRVPHPDSGAELVIEAPLERPLFSLLQQLSAGSAS
ncbi:23S rRNA pseudouridine(955/2504/2580) synthase RluC [Saccharospirillum mangrovi]|uniref:23S rRNA pseudouridine(955/2504/2580) synthase RluC n=2 Tax=Saccharospirillum mangrovi TaxID=2161747 RepID=UPI000D3C24EB|nr:23S rRNA pseudouridine(955/2504/2580) synthase RluC [Saccharospirillum mangrovi]